MIRPLNPLDLAVLISFAGSVPNEAAPRERLTVSHPGGGMAGEVVRHWLAPREKRLSLACFQGWRMAGLASMRERSGPGVWEVDGLFFGPRDAQTCAELLDASCGAVSKARAERLFLRLRDDSPALPIARDAGFTRFLNETLYQFPEKPATGTPAPPASTFRPSISSDEHALFRLYCSATPESVRSAQGVTFDLWRCGQERRHCREFLLEAGGQVVGRIRVSTNRDGGCFDVLMDPLAQKETVRQIVEQGVNALRGKLRVFCLVAEHQAGLRDMMVEMGCARVAEYSALVRQLALRQKQPSLMPSHA